MKGVQAQVLECSPEDEHVLRRLGGAVVAQWGALSPGVRDLLVRQATLMHDGDANTGLEFQIQKFIRDRQL